MSNSYECSINKNLGYYLKEDKLEKYKSRSANTLCSPLGLGKYRSVFVSQFTPEHFVSRMFKLFFFFSVEMSLQNLTFLLN